MGAKAEGRFFHPWLLRKNNPVNISEGFFISPLVFSINLHHQMGTELDLALNLLLSLQTALIIIIQNISTYLCLAKWDHIDSHLKRTRHLRRPFKISPRKGRVIPPRMLRYQSLGLVDIYDRTGIERSTFSRILAKIREDLEGPRTGRRKIRVTLSTQKRLLMVLHWLREYLKFKTMAQLYGVSRFFVKREIRHQMPILFVNLNWIGWPGEYDINPIGAHAAIDCTAHQRLRVHPKSADYFRGDKRINMMVTQLVVGFNGAIYEIAVGKGHNNDQAMFNITGMKLQTELNQLTLLADRGYLHHRIITPASVDWSTCASSHRVIVENVISQVKKFAAASAVFRQSPQIQSLAIIVCCELVAEKNSDNPQRVFPL